MSVWSTKSLGRYRDYIVLKHNLKGINVTIQGVKFRNGFAVVERNSKKHKILKSIPNLRAAKEYPLVTLKDLDFITRTKDIETVYGKDVYNHFLTKLEEYKQYKKIEERKKLEEETAAEIEKRKQLVEQVQKQDIKEEPQEVEKVEETKVEEPVEKKPIETKKKTTKKKTTKKKSTKSKNTASTNIPCTYITDKGTPCKYFALKKSPSGYCKMHILNDPKLEEVGVKIPNKMMTTAEKKKLRNRIIKKLQ